MIKSFYSGSPDKNGRRIDACRQAGPLPVDLHFIDDLLYTLLFLPSNADPLIDAESTQRSPASLMRTLKLKTLSQYRLCLFPHSFH